MKALVLIDLQYDFLPTGSLPVPEGDQVIAVANRLMSKYPLVVASQDWHPKNHGSFASNHPGKKPGEIIQLDGLTQILWPNHCVQNTRGAEIVEELDIRKVEKVFKKGTDPKIDSYSTFFDNAHRKDTGLGDYLKHKGVDEVHLMGLATDYCVKFSALDAASLGFKTTVLIDGCRGVEIKRGDVEAAIAELKQAGITVTTSSEILKSL